MKKSQETTDVQVMGTAYRILVSITNNTTSPITLNNINPLPSQSGNPIVINNFNQSAGNTGNGFIIFENTTVEAFTSCGGWYFDTSSFPDTQGTVVYNLSDGPLTINFDVGKDQQTCEPVPYAFSQWQAVISNNGVPTLQTYYKNVPDGTYMINLYTFNIVVQKKDTSV